LTGIRRIKEAEKEAAEMIIEQARPYLPASPEKHSPCVGLLHLTRVEVELAGELVERAEL
jgi:hypothetical protein